MYPTNSGFPFPFQLPNTFQSSPFIPPLSHNMLPYMSNLQNILSLMKLKQELQSQFKQENQGFPSTQSQIPNVEIDSAIKIEPTSPSLTCRSKLASPNPCQSPQPQIESNLLMDLPNDAEICLEAQVKFMIQFFINNYGTATAKDIKTARQRYVQDERLIKAFDALASKYAVTTKTREEMIKWIVRRALKVSKQNIKGTQRKDQKKLLEDLCKRYFRDDEVAEQEEIGKEWVDVVLPFRKNSKNKTMNANFIAEIFGSDEFRCDYKDFVKDFNEITEKENSEKMRRLARLVMECIKKDSFDSVAKYKRLPWLKLWIKNTKKVALELDEGDFEGKSCKKIKHDD